MTILRMPEVDPARDIHSCVEVARRMSAGEADLPTGDTKERCVAIITPGGLVMAVPCPPPSAVNAAMLEGVRAIVPQEPKRAIAFIAFTDVIGQGTLGIQEMNSQIPFLGYLMGMAFDGHTVVGFEGHPSALQAGCRDADVLIVDGAMTSHLPGDWVRIAGGAMRTARILVYRRDGTITAIEDDGSRGKNPPRAGRSETASPVLVGDHIRAGRLAEASNAATRLLRAVDRNPARNRPLDFEFTGEAYRGFFTSYFGLLGARDGGRVDPTAVATIDALLDELEAIYKLKGRGTLSRHLAAYFLRSVVQLLSGLVQDESPEGADEERQSIAALTDVLESALASSAGATSDDGSGKPSSQQNHKPWWKFW